MTPDQAKKPLPSSDSVILLEHPKTQYEWRYVLKIIKVEYQKGQWKKCLLRCNQLLDTIASPLPLYITCLHFYTALSEEAIALQLHNMSMAKIQTLQNARSCFEKAISSLPAPDTRDKIDESESVDSASDIDDAASLEDSVSSVGSPQPIKLAKRSSPEEFEQPCRTIVSLKPLPLQICKAVRNGSSSFNDKKAFFEAKLNASKSIQPITPIPSNPASKKPSTTQISTVHFIQSPSTPSPKPINSPTSTSTRLQSPAQERYNEQLRDFSQMLSKHVHSVEEAIAVTQKAQAMGRRRLIKERKGSNEEDDVKTVDLAARIARLKARGWIRERFIPERYQRLCERALAEL